jgi:phosphoglycolate phosphatase
LQIVAVVFLVLTVHGIWYIYVQPDVSFTDSHLDMVRDVELEDDIGAVVVGFDPHFSYLKMLKGASYLNRDGVIFIATNTDDRFPAGSRGIIMPGEVLQSHVYGFFPLSELLMCGVLMYGSA